MCHTSHIKPFPSQGRVYTKQNKNEKQETVDNLLYSFRGEKLS